MSLLFSQPGRDVVVGQHQVLGEEEGASFSSVEDDKGDEEGYGGSQEVESRVPWVPVDRGEHVFNAL